MAAVLDHHENVQAAQEHGIDVAKSTARVERA
jgi:hypothetical protein